MHRKRAQGGEIAGGGIGERSVAMATGFHVKDAVAVCKLCEWIDAGICALGYGYRSEIRLVSRILLGPVQFMFANSCI